MPAKGASAVREKERGPSFTVESRDLPILEVRMGLDILLILKERQQQKSTFERELKAAEAALARNETLLTVRVTSVVVLDGDDDGNAGPHIMEGGRSTQETPDFEADFEVAGAAPMEAISNTEGEMIKDVPDTRDLDLVGRVVSPVSCTILCSLCGKRTMRCTLLVLQKKQLVRRALEVNTLQGEKATQTKRIEDLTLCLAEKLSVRERSFADKRNTEDVVATKNKLTKQVKQLSARRAVLEVEAEKGNEAMLDLNVKLKVCRETFRGCRLQKGRSACSFAAVSKGTGQGA